MDPLFREVRKFVYDRFRETSQPPVAEEISRKFGLNRREGVTTLQSMQAERILALVPGTVRILMAHPFSALTTPYRVKLNNGQEFFANCAYDSVAMHVMLEENIAIRSFCTHCCDPILIRLSDETVESAQPQDTIIYLGLPFARWWDDIVNACSNTMLFFCNQNHLDAWVKCTGSKKPGENLSIEQALRLAGPTYRGRMELNYEKPSVKVLYKHFEALGLRGEFWAVG